MEDLQTVLSTIPFPQFVRLRLEYLTFKQPEILPFILNHFSTLRYLGIGPCDCLPVEEGDNGTKGSLTKTRGQMKKLEKSSMRDHGIPDIAGPPTIPIHGNDFPCPNPRRDQSSQPNFSSSMYSAPVFGHLFLENQNICGDRSSWAHTTNSATCHCKNGRAIWRRCGKQ
jgi:hypothetical protein